MRGSNEQVYYCKQERVSVDNTQPNEYDSCRTNPNEPLPHSVHDGILTDSRYKMAEGQGFEPWSELPR